MTESKKILFLSSWYPSKKNGTLGNFVQRHAEAVSLLHKVTVLYLVQSDDIDKKTHIEDHIINEVRTVIVYFRSGLIKPKSYRSAFKKALKYLGKKEVASFDLVHHNVILNQGWQALYLKKRLGIRYVITEHWTGYHNHPEKQIVGARKLLAQMVTSGAAFVMPVSMHLAQAMQSFGLKGNYRVVGNVVNTKVFLPNNQKPEIFTFLHVSHLGDEHKNISGMMRVFSELIHSGELIKLRIIGDGPIKPWIKLRGELGLTEDQIQIEGEKVIEEIAKALSDAHAFVLFSNYENLPCVIIEAFACGIPVIATDVGGTSELIHDKRGVLISKGNSEELKEAILKLKSEYHKFDSTEIRQFAVKEFSREMIAEKYNTAYNELKNN